MLGKRKQREVTAQQPKKKKWQEELGSPSLDGEDGELLLPGSEVVKLVADDDGEDD